MPTKNGTTTTKDLRVTMSVYDRLTLANNILSSGRGSLSEILNLERLRERLLLTPDEQNKVGAEDLGHGNWTWRADKEFDKTFVFTPEEQGIIKLSIEILGHQRNIPFNSAFVSLVRKFFSMEDLSRLAEQSDN